MRVSLKASLRLVGMTSQGELPIRLKVPEMSFKVREKLTTAEMSLRDMGMKLGISGIAMAARIQPTTTSGDASAGKSSRPPADIEDGEDKAKDHESTTFLELLLTSY